MCANFGEHGAASRAVQGGPCARVVEHGACPSQHGACSGEEASASTGHVYPHGACNPSEVGDSLISFRFSEFGI